MGSNRGMVSVAWLRCFCYLDLYCKKKKTNKKSWHTVDDYEYDNVDRFVKKAKAVAAHCADIATNVH